MKIFYFTATGNSLKVAKSLCEEVFSIPQMLKRGQLQFEDDAIGFVFPCYVGSIPTVVEEFLSKGQFHAKYIFGIQTYGNIAIGSTQLFASLAETYGLHIDYISKIKMVDTSLKYYDMKKQVADLYKKNVDEQVESIRKDVMTRKKSSQRRGLALKLSKRGYLSYRKEIGDCDKLFSVEAHCQECGVCANVCPVNNIKIENGVVFQGNCIRCYACTQNCPHNAIRFQGEKSKARYRNADISLKEIILANK